MVGMSKDTISRYGMVTLYFASNLDEAQGEEAGSVLCVLSD